MYDKNHFFLNDKYFCLYHSPISMIQITIVFLILIDIENLSLKILSHCIQSSLSVYNFGVWTDNLPILYLLKRKIMKYFASIKI